MVEFAVVAPLMLLIFSFTIEGARLLWTHQVVVSGVRDAARYVARRAPSDICSAGGGIGAFTGNLQNIVAQSTSNASVLPGSTSVTGVTGTLTCVNGTLRINPVGVVTVTASVTVNHPLGGILSFFGGGAVNTLNYTVVESSRIHGE